jgi:hypothetical protein
MPGKNARIAATACRSAGNAPGMRQHRLRSHAPPDKTVIKMAFLMLANGLLHR